MSIWEIEITQTDCPNVDTTRNFVDTTLLIMNTQVSNGLMEMLVIMYSDSADELSDALRFLSSHTRVSEFSLISKKGQLAMLHYKMIQTSMFMKSNRYGFRLHPIVIRNGKEKWFCLYDSSKVVAAEDFNDECTKVINLKQLTHDDFFADYPVALMSINSGKVTGTLTFEEIELLRTAYQEGFFDWPRRVNLTTLSKKLSTSKSRLSYHFRSIERKVFKLLLG